MKIWLDDVRTPPDDTWIWCKNAFYCLGSIIANCDKIEKISFDHDLGQFDGKDDINNTGYYVATFIENWAFRFSEGLDVLELKPFLWEIHSANPVGRRNIEMAMRNTEKYWNKGN